MCKRIALFSAIGLLTVSGLSACFDSDSGGGNTSFQLEPVQMEMTYEYDALNRVTAVYYDNGVVERYSYDEVGNLLSVERTGP